MSFNKEEPSMPGGNMDGNSGFGHTGQGRPDMNPADMGYQGGQQGYHMDVHGNLFTLTTFFTMCLIYAYCHCNVNLSTKCSLV